MSSAIGFFLGFQTPVSETLMIGGEFEPISKSTPGGFHFTDEGHDVSQQEEIFFDLTINGFSGLVYYNLTDFFSLSGGLGYYSGSAAFRYRGEGEWGEEEFLEEETLGETDLGGNIGFLFGSSLNIGLTPHILLNVNANYRILSMTFQDEDYSNNIFGDEADQDSFGGFRFSGGLSYRF